LTGISANPSSPPVTKAALLAISSRTCAKATDSMIKVRPRVRSISAPLAAATPAPASAPISTPLSGSGVT
jgi:hypothetical protein